MFDVVIIIITISSQSGILLVDSVLQFEIYCRCIFREFLLFKTTLSSGAELLLFVVVIKIRNGCNMRPHLHEESKEQ